MVESNAQAGTANARDKVERDVEGERHGGEHVGVFENTSSEHFVLKRRAPFSVPMATRSGIMGCNGSGNKMVRCCGPGASA